MNALNAFFVTHLYRLTEEGKANLTSTQAEKCAFLFEDVLVAASLGITGSASVLFLESVTYTHVSGSIILIYLMPLWEEKQNISLVFY